MPAHKKVGSIIWTDDLAYMVGLITTDGNLSKDGRHLEFTSNDLGLINCIKDNFKLKNRISRKRSGYTGELSGYRIQFGNVILYKWLCSIGLMPNKTKLVQKLQIPNEFFFHFLRGHLDGDGTIRKYYDPVYPKSLRLYITFMSASLGHVVWIKEKVLELLGIKGFIQEVPRAFTLTYSKKNSIKLLSVLYPYTGVPALKRKFNIVKEFIKFQPE
jgi:hypothetical protein